MGVVIDINTLPCVFSSENIEHVHFLPLLKWIIEGKSKIIIGGVEYIKELQKCFSYYKLIIELNKVGKIFLVEEQLVENEQKRILSIQKRTFDFDDPHILALIIAGDSKILCSNDSRSFRYIQSKELYPKGKSRPKIYTSCKRLPAFSLLCDANLSPCCFPAKILRRDEILRLSFYRCE